MGIILIMVLNVTYGYNTDHCPECYIWV